MTTDASRLASTLSDLTRRLTSVERGAQLGNSSLLINGESVRVSDALTAGASAATVAAEAMDKAASAEAKADGAVSVYYSDDAPTGASLGDFWVDGSGHTSSFDGTSWAPVTSSEVAAALQAARNAEAAADGKITTFYGPDAPTAQATGDLWFDATNHLRRWNGTAWVDARDAALDQAAKDAADAKAAASGAVTSANGKNTVFYDSVQPTAKATGDLWFDPANGYRLARWTGSSWAAFGLGYQAISSLDVGRLVTGELNVGVRLIAGSSLGSRLELSSAGLRSYGTDGATLTGSYATATGAWSIMGEIRSTTTSGRGVVLSGNLNTAVGRGAGQPGLIFTTANAALTRVGQLYTNDTAVVLDSSARANSATDPDLIPKVGSSFAASEKGIFAYTEGADSTSSNADALQIRNDGYWRLGRSDSAARGLVEGSKTWWAIGNSTAGTETYGESGGFWRIGDISATRTRIWGDGTSLQMISPAAATHVTLASDGTWSIGHDTQQAVYSAGSELILRGRRLGGSIGVYPAAGSWFDVWPSDNGSTQGGMYVHGRFGADSVSATVKAFVIEHPLDPAKNLVHVATESPVAGVEYTGTVALDRQGSAVVALPAYFEALTQAEGRTVFLQAVDVAQPLAASSVADGRFTITGTRAGRASWLVKAARKDPGSAFEVEPTKDGTRPSMAPGRADEATQAPADAALPTEPPAKSDRPGKPKPPTPPAKEKAA